jgi:hypothetical protein
LKNAHLLRFPPFGRLRAGNFPVMVSLSNHRGPYIWAFLNSLQKRLFQHAAKRPITHGLTDFTREPCCPAAGMTPLVKNWFLLSRFPPPVKKNMEDSLFPGVRPCISHNAFRSIISPVIGLDIFMGFF